MTAAEQNTLEPREQPSGTPVSKFARFFRNYGIALGVIVATVPVLTKAGNLLPMYDTTKDMLTFATSLLSLLAIAILFGIRRSIGQAVFPPVKTRCLSETQDRKRKRYGTFWPVMLAFLAVAALAAYLAIVALSVSSVAYQQHSIITTKEDMDVILAATPLVTVPYLGFLALSYVVMFLTAAAAFIWLGLIEYMQSDLRISDADLLVKPYTLMVRRPFKLEHEIAASEIPPFFNFEYDPRAEDPDVSVFGPFCGQHRLQLDYAGKNAGGNHRWLCADPANKKHEAHYVLFPYDTVDASSAARETATRLVRIELHALGTRASLSTAL